MSSSVTSTSKDYQDGMNDGEQLNKWILYRKLKQMKKEWAPNSSAGRAIKEIEDYMGKPLNKFVCVDQDDFYSVTQGQTIFEPELPSYGLSQSETFDDEEEEEDK